MNIKLREENFFVSASKRDENPICKKPMDAGEATVLFKALDNSALSFVQRRSFFISCLKVPFVATKGMHINFSPADLGDTWEDHS